MRTRFLWDIALHCRVSVPLLPFLSILFFFVNSPRPASPTVLLMPCLAPGNELTLLLQCMLNHSAHSVCAACVTALLNSNS
jgi:hypothetical protein